MLFRSRNARLQALHVLDEVLRGHLELTEGDVARSREAEAVDADDLAVEADVLQSLGVSGFFALIKGLCLVVLGIVRMTELSVADERDL